MPEIVTKRVPENGMDCEASTDSLDNNSDSGKVVKTKKRGIVFLSTIPPYMNVAKIREIFSKYGEIGRIYLQPSTSMLLNFRLCYCRGPSSFSFHLCPVQLVQ